MKDFTKENFLSFWPGGYQEDSNYLKPVTAIINRYGDKNGTALELGCGNGYWTTQYLVSRFKQVIALDVLSKPIMFKGTDVIYNELMSNDYTCANISDDSIDFIWSFGLFCHLSLEAQQEYLVNVFRVLKTGGKGVIMFANYPRLEEMTGKMADKNAINGWFYCDIDKTRDMITKAGLVGFEDTIPTFRDTLAAFNKPYAPK